MGVAEAKQRAEGHEGSWAASWEGSRHLPWGGRPWRWGGRTPWAQQGLPGFQSEQPRAWGELGLGVEGREAWGRSWASLEELGQGRRGDGVGWAGREETGPRLL